MIHVMMKCNSIKTKCFKIIHVLNIHKLNKEIAENKFSREEIIFCIFMAPNDDSTS